MRNYIWYLVFDAAWVRTAICKELNEIGEFDGNDSNSLECPDGKQRPAVSVRYEIIHLAETRYGGKRNPGFRVLRQTGVNGTPEWWPPGQHTVPKKQAQLMTGSELLQKKRKRQNQVSYVTPPKDDGPPPFD